MAGKKIAPSYKQIKKPSVFQEHETENGQILLLVDNCPAHPLIFNFLNIELAFFLANTSSILQSMDQSVIKSLKGYYRKKMLMNLLETIGKTPINILHTVNL